MAIDAILGTALSGLRAGAAQANTAANNIVNQNTENFRPSDARTVSVVAGGAGGSGAGVQTQIIAQDGPVDLVREFSRLIAAEVAYDANATLIRRADEQADELIDLIG